MVSKEEFDEYIEKKLAKYQKNKIKYLLFSFWFNLFGFLAGMGFMTAFVGVGCFFYAIKGGVIYLINSAIIFSIGVGMMIVFGLLISKIDTLQEKIKNHSKDFIDYLMQGYNYKYSKLSGITKQVFYESDFVRGTHSYYDVQDYLVMHLNNKVELQVCDIVAKPEAKDKGISKWNKISKFGIYKGMFGYVIFPFDFNCKLSINHKYSRNDAKLEKMNLESINFNEEFEVYTDDQIEARKIITPAFMEDLLELNKLGTMLITIVGNKLYFGSNEKLFDVKRVRKGDITTIFKNYYNPINLLLNMVEILKENRIFKVKDTN